jgi:antitoxin (DNA-binding transcriptional repressor) of toxin-antitoxin stability system
MRTYNVGDFKTNFSEILKGVRSGEKVTIVSGKKKEIVAYLVPGSVYTLTKRPLGLLARKAKVVFKDDFKMTEAEFLGL